MQTAIFRNQCGVSLTEYLIILVLVALAGVSAVNLFGSRLRILFTGAADQLDGLEAAGASTSYRIVAVRNDQQGRVKEVLLSGQTNYIPARQAIGLAERGQIEGVEVVRSRSGSKYLRTYADGSRDNNLDSLAR